MLIIFFVPFKTLSGEDRDDYINQVKRPKVADHAVGVTDQKMKEEGKLGIVVGEEVDNKDDPYINMSCRL